MCSLFFNQASQLFSALIPQVFVYTLPGIKAGYCGLDIIVLLLSLQNVSGMMAQAQRRQCPAVSSSHSRGILCKAQAFTDGSEVEVPVGSMEGVLPQDGKQDPDEGKIATLRCTVRDVPGQEADLLADTLLSLGAQSARFVHSLYLQCLGVLKWKF